MTADSSGCPYGWEPAKLLAYVEGALSKKEESELELHLKKCSWCRMETASLSYAHNLLLKHPLAFHPDPDDLLRFVAEGEDSESDIASHVKSCAHCAEDVAFLREMLEKGFDVPQQAPAMPPALRERLQADHGRVTHEPERENLIERIINLISSHFRIPMLAVGTAAAVVLIAALFLPQYAPFRGMTGVPVESFEEKQPAGAKRVMSGLSREATRHQEPKKAFSDLAKDHYERDSEIRSRRREGIGDRPHGFVFGKKETKASGAAVTAEEASRPSRQSAAAKPSPELERSFRSSPVRKKESLRETSPRVQIPALSPTDREAAGEQQAADIGGGVRNRMQPPQQAPAPASATESSVAAPRPRKHQPMEVRIIDTGGRVIPWQQYALELSLPAKPSPPSEAESPESQPVEPADKAKQAFTKLRSEVTAKATRPGRLLVIRIEKTGEQLRLEGKLFDQSTNSLLRTIREDNVSRKDLRTRVKELVRRFGSTP